MLATRVVLPSVARRGGGLIASSSPIPDDVPWTRGLTFVSDGCLIPERHGPCETIINPGPDTPGEAPRFDPVLIRQGVRCTALSGFDLGQMAGDAIEQTAEWALGREFQTGTATGNPNLEDASVVTGAGPEVTHALGCLEEAALGVSGGRPVFIHVPPAVSAHLPRTVERIDGILRTAAGSIVVVSPGYTGSQIWATGEVWAAVGFPSAEARLDRSDNTDEGWADEVGIAVFDPCFIFAANTDVDCTTP